MYLVVLRTLGDFSAGRQQPQLRRGKLRGVEWGGEGLTKRPPPSQIRAKMGIWWGLLLMLHILHEIGFRVSPFARLWNTKGLNLVLWAG